MSNPNVNVHGRGNVGYLMGNVVVNQVDANGRVTTTVYENPNNQRQTVGNIVVGGVGNIGVMQGGTITRTYQGASVGRDGGASSWIPPIPPIPPMPSFSSFFSGWPFTTEKNLPNDNKNEENDESEESDSDEEVVPANVSYSVPNGSHRHTDDCTQVAEGVWDCGYHGTIDFPNCIVHVRDNEMKVVDSNGRTVVPWTACHHIAVMKTRHVATNYRGTFGMIQGSVSSSTYSF